MASLNILDLIRHLIGYLYLVKLVQVLMLQNQLVIIAISHQILTDIELLLPVALGLMTRLLGRLVGVVILALGFVFGVSAAG
jgi:hypothetical protein